MADVLILDDDEQFCRVLTEHLKRAGHSVSAAHTLEEGLARVAEALYDIVFLDVRLPDGSGLDILPELRSGVLPPDVIIVTGHGSREGAELAIKHGAWDYVGKGSSFSTLKSSLARALQHREIGRGAGGRTLFTAPDMVGHSPAFLSAQTLAAQAADSDVSVVVSGETGTGKELCALAIHENSQRSADPFVVVDCAALPDTLVGSVLFGHARGAFTGADTEHEGLIGQADGGTLFLDEIGDMPMEIQRAFLRVLQERRYRPIGSNEMLRSDFRVIAATHRDLDDLAATGAFRRDLLYRLRALTVPLPPLRERMDDIPLLTTHFVTQQCQVLDRDVMGINEGFSQVLAAYDWPGNVRELAQAVVGAVAKAGTGMVLFASHLPAHIRTSVIHADMGEVPSQTLDTPDPKQQDPSSGLDFSGDLAPLREMRDLFERAYLEQLVDRAGRDIEAACRISGLSRPHVYTLLKKHGLKLQ